MKKRVAVLQFPGINSEYETRRALWDAGMDADFFRWNDNPSKLDEYDGFVIAGGFSYEDRGRAGLIASMDPVMNKIKKQASMGKPVLGICNGAQILVETGLVPGGENNELLMSLARNKRVKNGQIIGTGFYNENVYIKSVAPKSRTAFTIDYDPEEIAFVPVAHGEGRFTTIIPELFDVLEKNQQIIFKYCDEHGETKSDFPVNPNGAMHNASAISNTGGNVLAIMPHPERGPNSPMPKIFTSMRKYMEGESLMNINTVLDFDEGKQSLQTFTHKENSVELYVELIITDNEAQTVQNALKQHGLDINIRKWTHYQVDHKEGLNQEELAEKLIASGELLNTNKETATVVTDKAQNFVKQEGSLYFLVQDREDSVGAGKTFKLMHHFEKGEVEQVHSGTVWELSGNFDLEKVLGLNVLANHHAQSLRKI